MPVHTAPPRRVLLAALVLGLVAPAGVASAGAASAAPIAKAAPISKGAHLKTAKARVVPLHRGHAAVPHGRVNGKRVASQSSLTTADSTQVSLVTGSVPSSVTSPMSTWQVTFNNNPVTHVQPTTQQKASFQAAVNIWAGIISSPVPIKVSATFQPTDPNLLGYAGATNNYADSGLGDGQTFYPSALANVLAGYDVDTAKPDITAVFSSSEPRIYYGTDGLPPANYVDFESVVLHELGHGLGFAGSMGYSAGMGSHASPYPFGFDRLTQNSAGTALLNYASPSLSLGSQLVSNGLYWGGAAAKAANGGYRPRLFAPSPWQPGSSYSHLNEASYPAGNANSLMTPVLNQQEVIRDPGPLARGMFQDLGYPIPPPGPPTGVVGTPNNGGAYVNWNAPATGSAPTSYLVTVVQTLATQTVPASTRKVTFAGLTNSSPYSFTVKAINGSGSATSAPSLVIYPALDTARPTAKIVSGPGTYTGSTTVTFGLGGTDPSRPGAVFTYRCARDGAALVACPSSTTFTGLAAGAHTFQVFAKDESGNESSVPATRSFTVDSVSPVISTTALPVWSTGTSIPFSYSGSDVGTGVASYDVRYRQAAYNASGLSAYQYPNTSARDWTGITAKSVTFTAVKGYTFCLSARSRDRASRVSGWSADRCTAVPLDDRSLTASTGWSRGTSTGYYAGTITSTNRSLATLTRTTVAAKQIVLMASSCSTCGSVSVFLNGVLLKTISLSSPTTINKKLFGVAGFTSVHSGTLVVKTLSTKTTRIDGVGLSKV